MTRKTTTQELKEDGFDLSRFNRSTGSWSVKCSQCEALVVNGVATHENRCPNAPRMQSRHCQEEQ